MACPYSTETSWSLVGTPGEWVTWDSGISGPWPDNITGTPAPMPLLTDLLDSYCEWDINGEADTGGACLISDEPGVYGDCSIDLTLVIDFVAMTSYWRLSISGRNSGVDVWTGTKLVGLTPAGTYSWQSGGALDATVDVSA